jgi:DNA-binding beta-propeller fold protein YncE
VNLVTRTTGQPINVNSDAVRLAITPNGKTVYIDGSEHTVVPISTATNTAGKPIKAGSEPFFIAITPDGTTAYVASNAVYAISTATGTARKVLQLARFTPMRIAITADGKTAWVSGIVSGKDGRIPHGVVVPISLPTGRAGQPINVGEIFPCLVTTPWRSGRTLGPSSCSA